MVVGVVYALERRYALRPEEGVTAPEARVLNSCAPPSIAAGNGTYFFARVGSSFLLSLSPAQRLYF